MKLDKIDKNKSFAKRLLNDFTKGLFLLLTKKRLEDITVAELCETTGYPRSTFYNYFEDIYALMDYCWISISESIKINDFKSIDHTERTLTLFNALYDFMESKRDTIDKLLIYNHRDEAMLISLNKYIKETIYKMVNECEFSSLYPIPKNIVALHYSNTVEMILSSCFLDKSISKKDALKYLDFLLGTLEKESTRK